MNSLSNQPIKSIRNIFVFLIICLCVLAVNPLKAQETGPLLMKQQLGYTLAGGVAGVGIGALLWFMDPLNPNIQPMDQAKDGFVYGTAFGALFGFYLLNNSINFPTQNAPVQNFDDLLGMENRRSSRKKTGKGSFGWHLSVYEFRF